MNCQNQFFCGAYPMKLLTGEGSKTMAVIRGAAMGLLVVILMFGAVVTVLLLFR
jgi:hypothetical protein